MTARRKVLAVWLVIAAFAAAIVLPLWGPLQVAWQCYWLYASGAREPAEVIRKLENETLALHITAGPHAGRSCTAGTTRARFDATREGDVLEVVYLDARPGDCELGSTIETSAHLLWIASGLAGAALLGLLALGIFLHRSFTRGGEPASRMRADPGEVRCPACGGEMAEGYLVSLAGIHWRCRGEPIGLPHALAGLPGTVGWRGRPRLHGFRCAQCEIVTFQYGKPPRRPRRRAAARVWTRAERA